MGEELKISAYAVSIPGREQNLDNVYVNGRYLTVSSADSQSAINKVAHADFQVYGVCDGHVSGASESSEEVFPAAVAMQRLQRLQNIMTEESKIDKDRIWDFLVETNSKIKEYKAAVDAEEVQASYAGLFLHGNRGLAVHLGDSRMYVVRGGRMLQITEDHLEATDLYKYGILTQKQAEVHKSQSKLTAYLGMDDIYDAEETVFSKFFVFYPDDLFIICSDGITDHISNEDLERLIRSMKNASAEEVAQNIVAAVSSVSEDDKSIVVLHVEDTPGGSAAPNRGTAAMPQKRNFEKDMPQEEPMSDTTRLSQINEGVQYQEQNGQSQIPNYVDGAEAPEGYSEGYDEDDDFDDEPSIIDKLLGNPKRLAICLGGVLIVVVLLVAIFGRGGSKKADDNSSAPESTEVSSETSDESSDESSETSVVVPGGDEESSDSSTVSPFDESSDASDNSSDSSSDPFGDSSDSSDESSGNSQSGGGVTYTVEEGDLLYNIILDEYGFFTDELCSKIEDHNGVSAENLQAGMTLELPTLESLGISAQGE